MPASRDEILNRVLERAPPEGTAERRALEEEWFANMAYLKGRQWFVPENGMIRPPRDRRVLAKKVSENLILPKVMRAIAQLIGVQAAYVPLPMSDHREDIQAARLAELAFLHAQEVTRFRTNLRRTLVWAAVSGSGFLRISWNQDAGEPRRIYLRRDRDWPDAAALFDPDLRQELERDGRFRDVKPGEVECAVVEPFQFHWDRSARGEGIGGCQYVYTQTAIALDKIEERWGKRVTPDANELRGSEIYRDVLAFIDGDYGIAPLRGARPKEELARVVEYFERPSKRYPKGLHAVIAGGEVLAGGDNPYVATGSPLPFVKFDWFPPEGSFMGVPIVGQLRGPQRARNEARQQTQEFMRRTGFAPVLLPRGSSVTPKQIAAFQGIVFEYDSAGPPPTFGSPPQMPQYLFEMPNVAESAMDKISAQASPTNNRLPGQLRSGVGIQAVQADNNLILTPTSESMLESIAEVGRQCLQLMGVYYDAPRLMAVSGRNGEIEIRHFVGSDLRGHYNLRVVARPGMLDSVESRREALFEAAQLGILDPRDPEQRMILIRGLAFHTKDEHWQALVQQEQAEWREIDRIVSNENYMPAPRPWNDAGVRARVLERFLNSAEFERVPPSAQERLVARWDAFKTMLAGQMELQMAMMEASKGAQGQKGRASQPAR
jgi:hypothetical protein